MKSTRVIMIICCLKNIYSSKENVKKKCVNETKEF